MRVYFVNHAAAPDHLGGSEMSMLQLIAAWRREDPALEPIIVSPSRRGAFMEEARRLGYPTVVAPFEGWALFAPPGGRPEAALRIRRDFAATRRIIERMRAEPPDLVVTNTMVAPWGAYAAAAVGVPHVWFVREFGDPEQGFHFPAGRAPTLTDIGLLSARVVTNSHAVRDALSAYIAPEKLVVAYPSVDAQVVRARADEALLSDPFPLRGADLKVALVARVTRTKGQWRLVEALGLLRTRGVRVAACFVGATVEADADALLRQRAKRLGVSDAINFVGEQVNPFPFIRAADVGVTASDREAFGRATLEYLLLGKPVVATRSGGTAELLVDGENGYLVDPDDVAALADRLERYARDAALRRAHGEAARARGDELAAAGDVRRVVEVLSDAAGGPAQRLPATIVSWLAVPEMFSPTRPRVLEAVVRVRHLGRRLRTAARHPLATLRRRRLRRRIS